ncbi:MAG TPA: formate dehydrogenase, partial [Burkholderiales bacterium]|nr:formate dehydrogenase [Burkholderiales bacterium]
MTHVKLNRRRFLMAVGAGSAGAAAVALTKTSGPQRAKPAAKDDIGQKETRYRLTEHIRNYYR